jgi:hypothetical protein
MLLLMVAVPAAAIAAPGGNGNGKKPATEPTPPELPARCVFSASLPYPVQYDPPDRPNGCSQTFTLAATRVVTLDLVTSSDASGELTASIIGATTNVTTKATYVSGTLVSGTTRVVAELPAGTYEVSAQVPSSQAPWVGSNGGYADRLIDWVSVPPQQGVLRPPTPHRGTHQSTAASGGFGARVNPAD